jgi:hypothetical protein
VGSGLILLVIVGAWLAVLVPMAVRSHDSTSALKSADRFSDAMRVLSARRSGGERRGAPVSERPSDRLVPPLTAAERRRRTLLALVGAALLTLGLALLGPTVFLVLHAVCDLLLVAFVVHLRRLELRRTARVSQARRPAVPVPAAAPAPAAAPRTAGIPDRMPARTAPLTAPLPAPAARYDDAAGATGTDGSWSPVPVPPPTYVGKPVAPPRPPRVLDLTKPGEWSAAFEDVGLDLLDEGPEIEDILDRRRAANGW